MVKHVAQRGHRATEVAERLGVSIDSLYAWTKCYGVPEAERQVVDAQSDEMQDVFDYVEMFDNPKRRHSFSNDMSPVEYEKQYFQRLSSV